MNILPRQSVALRPPITAEEYARFCEFFYRKTGILFNEKKAYFVERRLHERIEKAGCENFRAYFAMLRFQPSGEQWQKLVNDMTVNETYFLREDYQFDVLVHAILPEIARGRRSGDRISLWSFPCSTGEEPYSIAIHILENWSRADDFAIEIAGSDIDSRVVAAAREGVYGDRSLQRLPDDLRARYFRKIGADRFQIREELRDSIDFSVANIVESPHMARFKSIDVVFCRNMLIYFDDASRRQAVELLYECMSPGGFICLGHSESMSRISSLFRPRKFGDIIVYQKAATGDAATRDLGPAS